MGVTPPRVHAPTSLEGKLATAMLPWDKARAEYAALTEHLAAVVAEGDGGEGSLAWVSAAAETLSAAMTEMDAAARDPAIKYAREKLVQSVNQWLWKHARGWWIGAGMKGDLADYHAAAVLEAWKSVLKFDPGRGIKFISYVTRVLRFGLSRTARNEAANGVHTPQKHGVIHYPTMHFSAVMIPDGNTAVDFGVTVAGRSETPAPPTPDDVWMAVRRVLRGHRFARRWEETLWLRYAVGATLDEIAGRFRVTKEAVRQWLKGAMEELRERKAAFEDVW